MSLLRTEGLKKHFGGVAAVDDLAMEVREGEIVGLIGPNGSGKTTALNMLSGFLAPDAGRVWLGEDEITGIRPGALARRGVVRMFQMTRVFPRISAFDNLITAGLARGLTEARSAEPGHAVGPPPGPTRRALGTTGLGARRRTALRLGAARR